MSAVLACSAVGSVALVFGVWLALMQSCEVCERDWLHASVGLAANIPLKVVQMRDGRIRLTHH